MIAAVADDIAGFDIIGMTKERLAAKGPLAIAIGINHDRHVTDRLSHGRRRERDPPPCAGPVTFALAPYIESHLTMIGENVAEMHLTIRVTRIMARIF